jgi:hypothetical protein
MISDLSHRFSVTFKVDEGHSLPLAPSWRKPCDIINFVNFRTGHITANIREHSTAF